MKVNATNQCWWGVALAVHMAQSHWWRSLCLYHAQPYVAYFALWLLKVFSDRPYNLPRWKSSQTSFYRMTHAHSPAQTRPHRCVSRMSKICLARSSICRLLSTASRKWNISSATLLVHLWMFPTCWCISARCLARSLLHPKLGHLDALVWHL